MESESNDPNEFQGVAFHEPKVSREMDRVIDSELAASSPVSIFIRDSEVPFYYQKWQPHIAVATWMNSPEFRERFQRTEWVEYLFPVFPSSIDNVEEPEEYMATKKDLPVWHVSDTSGRHYATQDSVIELIQISDIEVTAFVYVSRNFQLSEFEQQFTEVDGDTSPED